MSGAKAKQLRCLRDFQQPGAPYRGKPFWSWNGRLDADELQRQIQIMKRMGLGGFFMHSRVGLATPYLSREWFDAVQTCVEEARRMEMEAWLYDEDRWPSGAAGGLVTRDPKYRMRYLAVEVYTDPTAFRWSVNTLAAFVVELIAPDRAAKVRPLLRNRRPPSLAEKERLVSFRLEVETPSPWFNGQTYLDTMNPEAVRAFIRVTHEGYARQFRKELGGLIPGIFTDEPHRGYLLPKGRQTAYGLCSRLPWTERLPLVFRRRYGYDLLPHLPELVFDLEGQTDCLARYHYHDCVTYLFVDSFARQIGGWCERHGLQFTGHVLMEETLRSQTKVVGSCMRFYEHMQAPGMDLLTERHREFITAKQVTSVARQFGRRWRLTETYGCTGWDFPFLGHKALGDWQAALGINLRCQHLYWYTMLGEAKRDYPAAIGHQSPWWDAYGMVEDYFARIHAVMTQGKEIRDVLLIHPIESVWIRVRLGWESDPELKALDDDLCAVADQLLAAHLDFDFGDEDLLSRHGSIGRVDGKPVLRVNQAVYTAVVVPPQITMRRTTLDLLRSFHQKGGLVVFVGRPAGYVDGRPDSAVEALASSCIRARVGAPEVIGALEKTTRRVSIADPDGNEIATALYLLREDAEAQYLFLCNTGEPFGPGLEQRRACERQRGWPDVRVRAFAGCEGAPLELDPATGDIFAADAEREDGGWRICTSLPALGARLFVAPRQRQLNAPPRPKYAETQRIPLEGSAWAIRRSEPNLLVMDRCAWRIGDAPFHDADDILRVDTKIREVCDFPKRGAEMVQPWARTPVAKPRSASVELQYGFLIEEPPSGPVWLGIEQPEVFSIHLNGLPLEPVAENGWWTDTSLRTIPVPPGMLRRGRNELRLQLEYEETFSGLEAVYLLGEFGVRVEPDGLTAVMVAAPAQLQIGDWCAQGLPFYGGHVIYARRLHLRVGAQERAFIRLPRIGGVAARVWVDGRPMGIAAWPPFEVDITDALRSGAEEVDLAIEVLGHRRNSHGPLHYKEKWPSWTGPHQMRPPDDHFVAPWQLVPCGLLAPPEVIVRAVC